MSESKQVEFSPRIAQIYILEYQNIGDYEGEIKFHGYGVVLRKWTSGCPEHGHYTPHRDVNYDYYYAVYVNGRTDLYAEPLVKFL